MKLNLISICMMVFFFSSLVKGMEKHKFEKCKERGFCKRLREAEPTSYEFYNVYTHNRYFSGIIKDKKTNEDLNVIIESFPKGIVRLKIQEGTLNQAKETKFRLDVDSDILVKQTIPFENIAEENNKYFLQTKYKTEFVVSKNGIFQPEFLLNGRSFLKMNEKNSLQVESYFYKVKDENETKLGEGERAGISFDISFLGMKNIYGIPERAMEFSLPETKLEEEPYRLYNLDIFEYELNNKIGIYGNIPFLLGLNSKGESVGIFHLNPTDTFIDISKSGGNTNARFMSSNGKLNLFFIPGPTVKDVLSKYTYIVGRPFFPPKWSLGYHQCRWNYKSEEDVQGVDEKFDEYDIPYDTMWLDIEHTDGKKYFTWDKDYFPTPLEMQKKLQKKGRKLVTITDPHIKVEKGYFVYDEAIRNDLFIKNSKSNVFEGDCWPGKSAWLDFYNPEVRDYYSSIFTRYEGSSEILYNWIDMNEPSVFSGPEITMERHALHFNGVQHREIHNIYGYYHAMSAYEGHMRRGKRQDRPFILTRSFFGGSQKYAAVWTGDNEANWESLRMSIPMCLSLGIAGIPFIGADVGGFFNDPSPQLLQRWYQMGIFYPFFRAHGHIETKRREPWLFGDECTDRIRKTIILRYQLLPYIYTAFHFTSLEGMPVMSPLFLEYAEDVTTHTIQDQFMFGKYLLAKPVQEENVKKVDVYLPRGIWYNFFTGAVVSKYGGQKIKEYVDMDSIPLYQVEGSIIPLKLRVRRSSTQMKFDPYTLQIALNGEKYAEGELYEDDGKSFKYKEKNEYLLKKFYFINNEIISNSTFSNYQMDNFVEKIAIFGIDKKPEKIVVVKRDSEDTVLNIAEKQILFFSYDSNLKVLVIKSPNVLISTDFKIKIVY